ncbi:hypothetical protein [Rhizobium sp. BE258]|uniref:hypothetical protein n=1 Tax=Rhizobium sp. BE258 TaxID=2817722 RepID=UPI0028615F24|nr:hypothetical protein [Rhizobium sp. BE258]MDR7147133.1 hypothetical protein [Rhizobium sp. BE258]
MALSGAHIVCGYAGSYRRDKSQAILGKVNWSEAPATGVTTTNGAPGAHDLYGQPMFRLRASADSYFAVGPTPNATTGPRVFVPANTDYDVFADAGDKVQWVAA